MKIRKGFVSNSSSSSFVIDGNKYTCVDVALQMVDILFKEDDNEDLYNPAKYKEKYKKVVQQLINWLNLTIK